MHNLKIIDYILIWGAIASLWPGYILDWPSPVWDWLMYAMLGAMVWLLLRRVRQFRKALEEKQKEQSSGR